MLPAQTNAGRKSVSVRTLFDIEGNAPPESKAGLLTHRSSRNRQPSHSRRNSGLQRRSARCSQWRDRAGFTPASLFTRRERREPRNSLLFNISARKRSIEILRAPIYPVCIHQDVAGAPGSVSVGTRTAPPWVSGYRRL